MTKVRNGSSFLKKLSDCILQYKFVLLLCLLFLVHVFLQFYNLYPWAQFGWDQTDNAWAVKGILIDHHYPLVGMVAKEDTGFYIGPLYYYFISFFYFLTNMNPIASPIAAGVTSTLTFLIFFLCIRKIISTKVALLAVAFETFSFFIIWSDRAQWPVNFIPLVSMVIFYAVYKVITGNPRYLLLLGLAVGLSLQIHFTSVFYFPIIFLTLPFFPRTRITLWYSLLAIIIVVLFLLPNIIANSQAHNTQGSNLTNYIHTYYHGFHLRRVLQMTHDAFIEYSLILRYQVFSNISWIFLPLFSIVFYLKNKTRDGKTLLYLCWLWVIVPWFAFSTYSGELTNYYFYMTRPIALLSLAYLTYVLLTQRLLVIKVVIIGLWVFFMYDNMNYLFNQPSSEYTYPVLDKQTKQRAAIHNPIQLYQNIPASYLYWYYTRENSHL